MKNIAKKTQTRDKLIDAFFELYKTTPIEKISISQICAIAGYHRSTFYEYYSDIYDLLEQEEQEILKYQQTKLIAPIIKGEINILEPDALKTIIQNIYNYKGDHIMILLSPSGDPKFQQEFKGNILTAMAKFFKIEGDDKTSMYILEFAATGIIAVVTRMHSEGNFDLDRECEIKSVNMY